jgi:hypothetical protein
MIIPKGLGCPTFMNHHHLYCTVYGIKADIFSEIDIDG